MKTLYLLILLPSLAFAFTLNPDTARGFEDNEINIYIANTDCSGAGFSSLSKFKSYVEDAVDDYWNSVATSSIVLNVKGIDTSKDITGMSFTQAINITKDNTILAGCNQTASTDEGTLGAAVMDCNGDTCRAVLIINAHSDSAMPSLDSSTKKAVIAHELGHAVGLGHSEYTHNLMYYSTGSKTQKWLGEDDIDGISWLYPQDKELMGLLGSCGTIAMVNDDDDDFPGGSFLFALVFGFMSIALFFRGKHLFTLFTHKFFN